MRAPAYEQAVRVGQPHHGRVGLRPAPVATPPRRRPARARTRFHRPGRAGVARDFVHAGRGPRVRERDAVCARREASPKQAASRFRSSVASAPAACTAGAVCDRMVASRCRPSATTAAAGKSESFNERRSEVSAERAA